MGTRGLMGFRKSGTDKVTYNHWDSYPSGLGVQLLRVLKKSTLTELNNAFEKIVLIDQNSKPTKNEIKILKKYADTSVSRQSTKDWYCLLRQTQGKLGTYVKEGLQYMIDSSEFIKDSLFCEWAYIVNLDTSKFEVWIGFQTKPDSANRYGTGKTKCADDNYYPCKLIREYNLRALPTCSQFLKDMEKLEKGELT